MPRCFRGLSISEHGCFEPGDFRKPRRLMQGFVNGHWSIVICHWGGSVRIRGLQPLGEYSSVCELPRAGGESIHLRMQPLRLGFARSLRERGIVPPEAPLRVARDSAGRPVRDERGQAVTVAAESDGEYLRASELYHQRVAVLAVVESLEADPEVMFEARTPDGDAGWVEYADAVYAEMERAGFTAGDLVHLCSHACRVSNLTGDHLREAGWGFSSVRPDGTG